MGWLQRLNDGLNKTRTVVRGSMDRLLGRTADPVLLEEFEAALISSDLGAPVAERIIDQLKQSLQGTDASKATHVQETLQRTLLDVLRPASGPSFEQLLAKGPKPFVVLVVGVNGVGKTTTIGKLAQRIKDEGNDVLICAADTFRAAASDQLEIWAGRAGVPIVQQKQGTDPAAVLFDALQSAKSRNSDVRARQYA